MSLHFIRPEWFLALLPLALLVWKMRQHQSTHSDWHTYIAPHLMGALLSGEANKPNPYRLPIVVASLLLCILALAGPALTKAPLPVFASGAARVLVMDMSASMLATDMPPNRLAQAKFRATDLINQLKEGDTALIAFAGDAFVISPLTRDKATLLNLLPALSPDIMPALGSTPGEGVKQAVVLLSQAGHLNGDIVLMTDSLDEVEQADIRRALKDTRYRLAIYGFGTAQGAPMKLTDGSFIRGPDNQLVMPTLNSAMLREFASSIDGLYLSASVDGAALPKLISWLEREGDATATELLGDTWVDLGPYIAILLLIPVLLAFRHGLAALLLLCLLPGALPKVYASPWQTADQQAMEAYRQGDYSAAAKGFERGDWQAAAEYRAGNYDAALKGFEADNSADGLYNQGNALMQLGQYQQAAKRYQEAIAKNPELANAKTNLDLANKLLEQQAKQQQQNADKDKQQGNNQQNQQNDGEQNQQGANQQNQQDGGEQNQQSANQQNQQGNSGKNQQAGSQNSTASQNDASDNSALEAPMSADTQDQVNKDDKKANESEQSRASQQEPDQHDAQSAPPQASPDDGMANGTASRDEDAAKADKAYESADEANEPGTSSTGNAALTKASNLEKGKELSPRAQRILSAVEDDPAVLLRNKMQLEYQLRRERGEHRQEKEKW